MQWANRLFLIGAVVYLEFFTLSLLSSETRFKSTSKSGIMILLPVDVNSKNILDGLSLLSHKTLQLFRGEAPIETDPCFKSFEGVWRPVCLGLSALRSPIWVTILLYTTSTLKIISYDYPLSAFHVLNAICFSARKAKLSHFRRLRMPK